MNNHVLRYHRSRELWLQFYSDQETLEHFVRFARIYAAWKPYRMELGKEASEIGLPDVRHPYIHYPQDPEVLNLRYQFMVGTELMVAPVLDPGTDAVEVFLPAGVWVHLWTGDRNGSSDRGTYETISAPIGEPAVFYREDSAEGLDFREELRRGGLLRG